MRAILELVLFLNRIDLSWFAEATGLEKFQGKLAARLYSIMSSVQLDIAITILPFSSETDGQLDKIETQSV
jgi:hypothetical protein